ncbi:hypothetical protein RHMOL_Rhmol05G0100200 [Rhododendron molle]|uniref:Uncharacterized protein n=1 Tax=Rhododendron molle TaxID=49168 RepID=A0ACC0NNS2_RHOML|nr:hypothetical protein RHMOL_Rhmol05G0100200 [Rhododendron molle]
MVSGGFTTRGFGYGESVDDYKVVILFSNIAKANVYSLRTNSWGNKISMIESHEDEVEDDMAQYSYKN